MKKISRMIKKITLFVLILLVVINCSAKMLYFNDRDYPDVDAYFDQLPASGISITTEKGEQIKIHNRKKVSDSEIVFMIYPFSDDRSFINYIYNFCKMIMDELPRDFKFLLSKIVDDECKVSIYFETEKEFAYYPLGSLKDDVVTGDRHRDFFTSNRSEVMSNLSQIDLTKHGIFYDSLYLMIEFLYYQARSIPYLIVFLDGDVIFEDSKSKIDSKTLNEFLAKRNIFVNFVILYSDKRKKVPPVIERIKNKKVFQVLQTDLSADELDSLMTNLENAYSLRMNLKQFKRKGEKVKLKFAGKDLEQSIQFNVPYNLGTKEATMVLAPKSVNNPYVDFTYIVSSGGSKLYEGSLKAGKSVSFMVSEGKYNITISDTFFKKEILKNCFKGDTVIVDPVFVYSDLTFVTRDSYARPVSIGYKVNSNGKTIETGATGSMGSIVIKLLNNNLFALEAEMGLNKYYTEITPYGDQTESFRKDVNFFIKNYYINTKDLNGKNIDSFFIFSKNGKTVLTGETGGNKLLDIPPGDYQVSLFWGNERIVKKVKVDEGKFSGLTCNFSSVKLKLVFAGDLKKRDVFLKIFEDKTAKAVLSQKIESNHTTVNVAPGNYVLKIQSFDKEGVKEVDFSQSVKVSKSRKNYMKIELYNANLVFDISDLKGPIESTVFKIEKVNESGLVTYRSGIVKSGHVLNVLPGEYLVTMNNRGLEWKKQIIVNRNEFRKIPVQFFGVTEIGFQIIDSKGDKKRPDDFYLKMDNGEWLHVETNPLRLLLRPGKKKMVIKREKNDRLKITKEFEVVPGKFFNIELEYFRILKVNFEKKLIRKAKYMITDFNDKPLFKEQLIRRSKYEYLLPLEKYRLKVRMSNQDSYFFVREIFNLEPGTVEAVVK